MIREGKKNDLPAVLELVKELAEFEKGLHNVSNTVEMMEADGFGVNPVYGFYVVEEGKTIVGAAIYYFRYSTWKGKRLYLEDLIVTESKRGKGYGKLLFEKMLAVCKSTNCTGMMWQVLDWNTSAIDFYKQYGTEFDNEWLNCHIDIQ